MHVGETVRFVLTARLHLVGDGISSGKDTNDSKMTDFLSHF